MVKNIEGARCTRPHRDIVAAPAQAVIPSVERGIFDAHTLHRVPSGSPVPISPRLIADDPLLPGLHERL